MKKKTLWIPILAGVLALALAAGAQSEATPITSWMDKPVTPLAHEVKSYVTFLTLVIAPFMILPQALLLMAIFKFRDTGKRKPATFHDNLVLEVIWTIVPVLALVVIAIPSYSLIKKIENPPTPDMRIEIIGHQFFWEYRYPEHGDVRISDEPLVVPINKNIVADVTSVDVIHAWWVPSFAVKIDAVPGRVTQLWFNIDQEGWFKGQCAELCGSLHSKMLIDVKAVPQEEFDAWIAEKQGGTAAPETSAEH